MKFSSLLFVAILPPYILAQNLGGGSNGGSWPEPPPEEKDLRPPKPKPLKDPKVPGKPLPRPADPLAPNPHS